MQRVWTAVVGIPLVLVAVYFSPPWLFAGLVALVAALALDEFLALCRNRGLRGPGRWFLWFGAAVTGSFVFGPSRVLASLFAAVAALPLLPPGTRGDRAALDRITAGAAGIVYICVPLGFLTELSRPGEILLLLGIVWAGDTAAYYVGRTIGRRRVAPLISPNKTLEGSAGGLLASALVAVAAGRVLLDLPVPWLAALGLATALAGQLGDLAESAIKRNAGAKDSSSRLPGHGGFLDRIDSLLFATPVFLFLLRL